MKPSELNYIDRVLDLALNNAIANTQNGTSYQYYWEIPRWDRSGSGRRKALIPTICKFPTSWNMEGRARDLKTGQIPGRPSNKPDPRSRTWCMAGTRMATCMDGEQTHRHVFQGKPYFQKKAYEQMGEARARQAVPGLSRYSDKAYTLQHPVIGNPGQRCISRLLY